MPPSTITPPQRSAEQRMEALAKANCHRLYRAEVKRQLKARKISLGEVLRDNDPRVSTMKVYEAMCAVPGIGDVKARKLLALEQVSMAKTLGGLSPRQRGRIMEMFGARGKVSLPEAVELVMVPAHWKAIAA